jgi:thioredoxin reductase (NADPH)
VAHLARSHARKVTLLARADRLEAHMADYLVQEIKRQRNVEVRLGTEVVDAEGDRALKQIRVRDKTTGAEETLAAETMFVLIGADPHTDWLADTVARDDHGFLLTGRELGRGAGGQARAPLPFETSLPGVFAVGDVRSGSSKRLATAVGEGAAVVTSVHAYLAMNQAPTHRDRAAAE